jgi:hypothetical protein
MLKWLFRRKLDAFDRDFGYDSAYVRDILEADFNAAIKFASVMGMDKYRKGTPPAPRCAAKLVGILAEDCGPCTQLVVTMAEREGVAPDVIKAILNGDTQAMTDDVLLAFRFAHAVLEHDPHANGLREQVVQRWGKKGLISLAFAITMARFFPTLKYAMGHGQACSRVQVGGATVTVGQHPLVV